mmetsp:Transcript_21132/g.52386  ORF Transcript_21132/g.52386 Transcript_21132/m.52386 type:complete len:85 (-) Transcript_21132:896-1150(-)
MELQNQGPDEILDQPKGERLGQKIILRGFAQQSFHSEDPNEKEELEFPREKANKRMRHQESTNDGNHGETTSNGLDDSVELPII